MEIEELWRMLGELYDLEGLDEMVSCFSLALRLDETIAVFLRFFSFGDFLRLCVVNSGSVMLEGKS